MFYVLFQQSAFSGQPLAKFSLSSLDQTPTTDVVGTPYRFATIQSSWATDGPPYQSFVVWRGTSDVAGIAGHSLLSQSLDRSLRRYSSCCDKVGDERILRHE